MEQQYVGVEPGSREEDTGALRSAVRRSIAAAEGPTGPRGEMYTSFGQGFSRAFELAVTPTLFGAMGYGLDQWLGTLPVFTAIFSLVALVAMLLRTWYGYCHRMEALEAQGPWARHRPSSQPPGTGRRGPSAGAGPEVAR